MKEIIRAITEAILKIKKEIIFVNKEHTWFYITFLVGLYPIIIKITLILLQKGENSIKKIDIGDFITFGLIMNIGNIIQFIETNVSIENNKRLKNIVLLLLLTSQFTILYVSYLQYNYNTLIATVLTIIFNLMSILLAIQYLSMEKSNVKND